MKSVIIIPARLAAQRLPGKPLREILGKPMILWVCETIARSGFSNFYVASGDKEILDVTTKAGYGAIATDVDLPSGTDRVYQAYKRLNIDHDLIINVQGDIPYVPVEHVQQILAIGATGKFDMYTLGVAIDEVETGVDSIVKIHMSDPVASGDIVSALSFSRNKIPYGSGKFYEHIGIYGYTPSALEKFVGAQQTSLEVRERLEQLRALELGMRIGVGMVHERSVSVDVEADLQAAAKLLIG